MVEHLHLVLCLCSWQSLCQDWRWKTWNHTFQCLKLCTITFYTSNQWHVYIVYDTSYMSIAVLKFKFLFIFSKGQVLMKSFILKGKANSSPSMQRATLPFKLKAWVGKKLWKWIPTDLKGRGTKMTHARSRPQRWNAGLKDYQSFD